MLHLDSTQPFLTQKHFEDASAILNINSYVEIGKGTQPHPHIQLTFGF